MKSGMKCQRLFPIPVTKETDVLMWCETKKIVNLVGLRIPHEHNMDATRAQKIERYVNFFEEWDDVGLESKAGVKGLLKTMWDDGFCPLV